MLQQTQVNTVIPYFNKFMQSFPTVKSLALADLDVILQHWSGLGYYARARNLAKTALIIHSNHHGRFPKSVEQLIQLPGIGRSTAGAILSLGMNIAAPILDGNVKRVLARYFEINGWPGNANVLKEFWNISETNTPTARCRDYNQAMMDLGALICRRTKPTCSACPLNKNCQAYLNGTVEQFPFKKVRAKKPKKEIYLLILRNGNDEILLEKRPSHGIWGGLWSFPECTDLEELPFFCKTRFNCKLNEFEELKAFKHIFSHFELTIKPVIISVKLEPNSVMESQPQVWYNTEEALPGGIPKPVAKIMQQLTVYI